MEIFNTGLQWLLGLTGICCLVMAAVTKVLRLEVSRKPEWKYLIWGGVAMLLGWAMITFDPYQ